MCNRVANILTKHTCGYHVQTPPTPNSSAQTTDNTRPCLLQLAKEAYIYRILKNTGDYDNLWNFLRVDGAARLWRADTILKRESLQPGSNNKCSFMYNSPYRAPGFVRFARCLRFTAFKTVALHGFITRARPNRPIILIILLLDARRWNLLRWIAAVNRRQCACVSASFHGCEKVDKNDGTRSSCVKQ